MGFHYANEKKKFDHEWKRLRKEYADAGMSPSAIEAIHDYDWEAFLSRRTYENHTQPLPDAFLSGEVKEQGSKLFKKYSSLSAAFDEEDFLGRYAWLSSIEDTDLSSLSATRTYPNLSDADLELIPKTITDGGKTLTLGAVEWSGGENGFYTATASYTGTSSTRSATGYTVTASYTGQVAKTDCEVVTYTAIFGSVELAEDEKDAQESSQPESPAPDADPDGDGVALLPILGCVGGVAAVAAAAVWAIQTKRGRRSRT